MTGFIIVLICVLGSLYVGLRQHTPHKNPLLGAARAAGLKLRSVRDYYFFDHHPLGPLFEKKEDLYAYDIMTSDAITAFHVHFRGDSPEGKRARTLFLITTSNPTHSSDPSPTSELFEQIQSKLHMWSTAHQPLIVHSESIYAHLYFDALDPNALPERLKNFHAR